MRGPTTASIVTSVVVLIIVALGQARADAGDRASDCECTLSDPGAKRRGGAKKLALAGAALLGGSFVLAVTQKHRYDDALDRFDRASRQDDHAAARAASDDANRALHITRWYGTGMFAAGTIGLGVATYLYLTAPSREVTPRTVVLPDVAPGRAGLAFVRSF